MIFLDLLFFFFSHITHTTYHIPHTNQVAAGHITYTFCFSPFLFTYHTCLLLFSFHIISWIAFLVWWFLRYVLQVIQSIRLLFLFHSYTVYITFLGVNLSRIDSSQYSSFNHSRIATTSSLIIASQLLRTNVMMNGFKVREHLIICFNFVVRGCS